MTSGDDNKRTDLFGEAAAKPLFGDDDSVPAGKPLFDNDFSDPGDAAFVKSLFGDSEEEDEPVSLDDFQEYDNIPDTVETEDEAEDDENIFYGETGSTPEEAAEESAPAEDPVPVQEPVPEEAPAAEVPVQEPVPAEEPAPAADMFAESAPQETKPPFSEDMFGAEEDTLPKPAFIIPAEKVALPGELESMSLGTLMAYARETVGLTPENVFDGTKINEKFLLAIEHDQFDKLPSGAFPGVYVRALCSFYHLDKSVCEIAQKKAAAYCTACRPPDEVYNSLPQHAMINKEEQEKFRRMITIAGIALFAIISLIVVLVTVSAVKKNNAQKAVPVVSPVKMEELEQLDPASPQVITSELDVPR